METKKTYGWIKGNLILAFPYDPSMLTGEVELHVTGECIPDAKPNEDGEWPESGSVIFKEPSLLDNYSEIVYKSEKAMEHFRELETT